MSKSKNARLEVLQATIVKKGFTEKGACSENTANHIISELYPRQTAVLRSMIEKAMKDQVYAGSLIAKLDMVVGTDNLDYTG